MKKLMCVIAAASALALVACEKQAESGPDTPAPVKPSPDTVVADYGPDITAEQKQKLQAAFLKKVAKVNKDNNPPASNWDEAIAAREQKVEYVHCWVEDDDDEGDDPQPIDEKYCHLYTENYDPPRLLRIIDNPSGGFLAYIRTDKNSKEFMFCDNLQVSEKLGPSFIEGDCTFRPHDGQGLHYAIFNVLKSSKSKKYDNIYFAYFDRHPDGSGGTEVHNGDAHGGDD